MLPNSLDSLDGGQNFVGLLSSMKIPFDCDTVINPQASIEQGSAVMRDAIFRVGTEFGSPFSHVHIVAHSKGGLFVRRFLQMNRDLAKGDQLPVLSLTTLDTPHHGSSLADSVYAWNTTRTGLNFPSRVAFYLGRLNPWTRRKILQAFGPGANDLTVDEVAKFNAMYPAPPSEVFDWNATFSEPISYYYTSADADLNGNGRISADEATPYNALVANTRYQLLGRIQAIHIVRQADGRFVNTGTDPTTSFALNDTAVTMASAAYDGFTAIGPYIGSSGRNHATIRDQGVAAAVMMKIRQIELSRKDFFPAQ